MTKKLTNDLQSSDAPAAEETRVQTKSQAAEQAKSFIAGGFGGASAVLVGSSSCF